ncbi:MAG: carbon-nitrogen family hydrolase [Deltaproteobacteria bacterium]|nr:carbon-nitrogen family hydrolase [Deltaproteobacteria bacterium]
MFRAASIQFDIKLGDVNYNLSYVLSEIRRLSKEGVRLIVLPEMWSTGYAWRKLGKLSERTSEIIEELKKVSKKGIVIIGSMPEKDREDIYNTAYVIDNGKLIGKYRKIHLFTPMKENYFLKAGNETLLCNTSIGKIGVLICYDIRFPDLPRRLTLEGAEILAVPAEWPHPRLDHWRTILKARAIENQLFVIATNRCGRQGMVRFCGNSMIVNPWGEIISEAGEEKAAITADVDLSQVARYREDMPALKNRRPEVY